MKSYKLEELYPAMSKVDRTFVMDNFLSSYEFMLSEDEDYILRFIRENASQEKINAFPHIKEKLECKGA